jgi:hypothetical protein
MKNLRNDIPVVQGAAASPIDRFKGQSGSEALSSPRQGSSDGEETNQAPFGVKSLMNNNAMHFIPSQQDRLGGNAQIVRETIDSYSKVNMAPAGIAQSKDVALKAAGGHR